jgi:uncharacterized protein (DUF433 family)
MTVMIQVDNPPLRQDDSGALPIGQSRLLLELVIRAFQDGATPEAIVQRYPSATLTDIYGAVTYYLRHREDIESYLAERESQAVEIRQRVDSHQSDLGELRRRLLGRRGE